MTQTVTDLLEQLEAALPDLEAELKAPISKADAVRDVPRREAAKLGIKDDRSPPPVAPDELEAFTKLRAAVSTAAVTLGSAVDVSADKAEHILGDGDYWRGRVKTFKAAQAAPKLSLKAGKRTFKGEAAHIASAISAHLSAPDEDLERIRAAPKDWEPDGPYPPEHTNPRGRQIAFGANPVQRGGLSGYGMVNYVALLTTGDERCVERSAAHLGKAIAGLTVRGGVNTTEDDGWLGWRYGMSSLSAGAGAGTYTALEAALMGGGASHARVLWENRTPERLELVHQYRAFRWLHHVPRWVKAKGEPTAKEPTYTRRNFAHSNMSEAVDALQIAIIETGMFRAGMAAPMTVTLPDGFNDKTRRTVPGGGDGRTVALARGTSADLKTHPGYKQAVAIFRQFNNGVTIRVAYGDDIKDPAMRALYGVTGAMYWDQTTLAPRFTANSGYNQMTYSGLLVLHLEGVIADVLGGQVKADAFMAAAAGGTSVGLLPEEMVSRGVTAYVFDNPVKNEDGKLVSGSYLVNGKDVRAFGGAAEGGQTDDSFEWDAELYGVLAPWDPADRIAKKTAELREHALKTGDGEPTRSAGGLASRMLNEIVRGRA